MNALNNKLKKMKIAIHNRPGSFSDRWTKYCKKNGIEYKLVNAYDNDIVEQVKDCDAFMWHHCQGDYRDLLFAKQLIYSLQIAGIKTFPDFNTGWHFDDKVGQKYLLEALNIPLVPTHVFYTENDAKKWAISTSYPKVFKLRGGAGSSNVMLVNTQKDALRLIHKAFHSGFSQFRFRSALKEWNRKLSNHQLSFINYSKMIVWYLLFGNSLSKMHGKEKGYVYFQDFIPQNDFDVRIVIVDSKAFAIKRMCRKDDFRASGSGFLIYDKAQIDERCVKIAFDANAKLQCQSIAFDFVFRDNVPLIVEISYGYVADAYDKCEGYWTQDMQWHQGSNFDFCGWMVEQVINR